MPPYSKIQTFVDALKTGETNITRSIDKLANDGDKRAKYLTSIQKRNAFDSFPTWLRRELRVAGMRKAEIDHVERWPKKEKESVRVEIVAAIEKKRKLHFGWEIYDGRRPVSDIRHEGRSTRIVFRSPRSGLYVERNLVYVKE